jgi:hypothetical protein
MKFLTRKGYLIEEQGMTYWADIGPETNRRPAPTELRWGPGQARRLLSFQDHLDTRAATDRAATSPAPPLPMSALHSTGPDRWCSH